MNVTHIKRGIPAFISRPHFLGADPSLVDAVTGLSTDPEKHTLFLDIFPLLAQPIHALNRFQFNIYVRPIKYKDPLGTTHSYFEEIQETYFPVVWIETDSTQSAAKLHSFMTVTAVIPLVRNGAIALSIIIAFFSTLCIASKVHTG